MANKPIWIICPASMKGDVLNVLTRSCPKYIKGLEEYGDVSYGGHSCRQHWLEFIDFDCGEEEGGEE